MKAFLFCVLLSVACTAALGAMCTGKPDPDAKPNLNTIYTAAPTFVRSVKNGNLYTVGDGEDKISIVHVWGSPYDWGVAQGTLMKDDANAMLNSVWAYMESQVEEAINGTLKHMSPTVQKFLADEGLDGACGLTYAATKKYSGSYFFDEMKGLSDASGVDYDKIKYIHMIGEVTKGACSMFGAWGKATSSTGSLLQLRALDWDVDGPFKNFPQITVYHPAEEDGSEGNTFANIGWTGWIGSITGMSAQKMAISEIGVTYPDASFGKESRFGVPFTFLLRDILQFDRTLDDSINRIANSKRTCNLILGVGDGKLNEFRSVQYSASVANFFDDENMMPQYDWHPRIDDVVYHGMDWLCPPYSEVLAKQLNTVYGNITAENVIRDIVPIVQTGDLHIALYDLTNEVLHTANARADSESGPLKAFDRTFVRIDMKPLWAEQKPTDV